MSLRKNLLELLKKPDVVNNCGIELHEIQGHLKCTESELSKVINELKREKSLVAIPFKHGLTWCLRFYSPPYNKTPIRNRIEEVFTELAIPPWVKTRVFRGTQVIFVGEYGKQPGFTIIDYFEDDPLVFHDKFAGGEANEIVNYKTRSKYKCTKGNKVIWYGYRGQKSSV